MKKLLLYGFLVAASLSVESCLFSEDDLFEQSSAERLNSSIIELKELLLSAENGWKLEYRYGSGGVEGAANIFMKFSANEVELASDFATSSYAPGETCTSMYTVKSYNGTELSFDSYNEILHAFCTPNGYGDPGYQGDYEFMIRSISDNEIHLTGKKGYVDMVMTRLDASVSWTDYLSAAAQVSSDSDYSAFQLVVGGQNVMGVGRVGHMFVLSETGSDGSVLESYYPFACTDKGIHMIEPFSVGGITMQDFTWDNSTNTFTCINEGVDAKLVFERPAGYDKYLGLYQVQSGSKQFKLRIDKKKDGRSYQTTISFTNGKSITVEFYYDTDREDISADGQIVGDYNGIPVYLYPGSGNSLYATVNHTFEGHTTLDDQNRLQITFVNNPYGKEGFNDWLFIYDDGGYYLMTSWSNPVFTRISD